MSNFVNIKFYRWVADCLHNFCSNNSGMKGLKSLKTSRIFQFCWYLEYPILHLRMLENVSLRVYNFKNVWGSRPPPRGNTYSSSQLPLTIACVACSLVNFRSFFPRGWLLSDRLNVNGHMKSKLRGRGRGLLSPQPLSPCVLVWHRSMFSHCHI